MQGTPTNNRASLLVQNKKPVLDLAKTSRNPLVNTSQNGNYSSTGVLNQLSGYQRSSTVQGWNTGVQSQRYRDMNKQRDHHVQVVKKEWKRQQHRKSLIKSTTLEITSQYDPAA